MGRARAAAEARPGAAGIVARVAAALPANYALTLGVASLSAVLFARVGMIRSEAATLASMLAYLLFLVVAIAAFATRRLRRFWLVLTAATALSFGLVALLQGGLA